MDLKGTCFGDQAKKINLIDLWVVLTEASYIEKAAHLQQSKGCRCNIPPFPKIHHMAASDVDVNMWRDVKHEVGREQWICLQNKSFALHPTAV